MRILVGWKTFPWRLAGAALLSVAVWNVGSCVTSADDSPLNGLVNLLSEVDDANFQLDLLNGMHDALRGRKNVSMPTGWPVAYKKLSASADKRVRDKSLLLALIFKDPNAVTSLRNVMMDVKADAKDRSQAIQSLVETGAPNLANALQKLLGDTAVRASVLRALASIDDERTPVLLIEQYETFNATDKQHAVNTLASRPSSAAQLLAAIRAGTIPRRDVHSFQARQIRDFERPELSSLLKEVWGEIRDTSADAQALISKYQKELTAKRLAKADVKNGRLLFHRTCAKCHTLYGEGGKIGPDITGANRSSLFYVLENILDPSASVAKQYQASLVALEDGRILSGLIATHPNGTVEIQTPTEKIIVPEEEIEQQRQSSKSMMPDGLLKTLNEQEIVDLIAYLQSTSQVPLPEGVTVK